VGYSLAHIYGTRVIVINTSFLRSGITVYSAGPAIAKVSELLYPLSIHGSFIYSLKLFQYMAIRQQQFTPQTFFRPIAIGGMDFAQL